MDISSKIRWVVVTALIGMLAAAGAYAQDRSAKETSNQAFRSVTANSVMLSSTGTLIFRSNPNAPHSASGGGEAFSCEGDPDGDYVCSNSLATYGCNEACACCYYEENYLVKPDGPGGLTAPFRQIQNSQIEKFSN